MRSPNTSYSFFFPAIISHIVLAGRISPGQIYGMASTYQRDSLYCIANQGFLHFDLGNNYQNFKGANNE